MKKRIIILSSILFIIDIIIKLIIKNNMNLFDSIVIIPNFFNITFVMNEGAAFSILQGKQIFLIILACLVLISIIYYIRKDNLNNLKVIYYSLLIGGILGNLLDRIIYNSVIDYLDFKIFSYDYPIFNLADTFIFFGVVLILIEGIKGDKNGNRSIRERHKN